jgi:hypothetical protein
MENLSFEIEAKLKKLTKGLDRASSEIESFTKRNEARFKKFGQKASQIGKNMSVALTLPLVALGTASVKAASDFEETESKFNTVFRNIQKDANETAEELRNAYGLSSKASLQLLSDTGDLLTGFGFTQQSALDLSSEVNKLAVDLASFTNFSGGAKGASQALTKALLGERESVKSLGISILEADVQAKVLKNTQEGLTFASERQAKAFATLQIAQEQSKNAIGDYARTSGSFANQMRLLQSRVGELGVEFGKILLPFAQKLVGVTQKIIKWFTDLSPTMKKVIVAVSALVAVAGPLLVVLGGIVSALPAILSSLAVLTGPIGLIIAAIGALTAIVISNWDTISKWAEDIANYFIDLYNESIVFRAGIELIVLNFKNLFSVGKFVVNALWTIIKTQFGNIVAVLKGAGEVIAGIFTLDTNRIKEGAKEAVNTIKNNMTTAFETLSDDANKLFDDVVENLKKGVENVVNPEEKRQVDFSVSKETKEKLTEDVATAVQKGVNKGMQGRAQTEAIAGASFSEGAIQSENNIVGEAINPEALDVQFANINQKMLDFANNANNIIQNNIANTFAGLGEIIGNALSGGGNVLQNVGALLLGTMGNLLTQLGKQAIVLGLTLEGVKKALLSFGGIGAIAIGTVAVALGKAFSNKAASLGQSLGSGGGGTGATTTRGGVDNNFSQSFAADREIILRARGRDLVAVLNAQNNFNNALG